MPDKPKLIVFDVEGVLIPKNRFLFEIGKSLGLKILIKFLLFGFLYEAGFLKLESALRRIFLDLKDVKVETLLSVFGRIHAKSHLQDFFAQLKERNCKTALISSGIPTFIVEELASSLGADYAYGVEVEVKEGKLTGEIRGDAITLNGKLKIMREILNRENLQLEDCAVVADDRNNRCIFRESMLKIGFNPDHVIRIKADRVVNGKLSGILSVIDRKPHKWSLPSINDLVRENIHAAGFFMPVLALLVGVPIVASFIILLAAVYAVSELYRLDGRNLPLISTITRHAASQSELYGFAAAPLYFAFGIVVTLIFFPSPANGAAIAIFCLGDSTASIFGGSISTSLPFNKGKTWEGSLAGFFFAFLAGSIFIAPVFALVGATIAMIIEMLPLPINDNILVPVVTGAVLTLLTTTIAMV